MRLHPRPFTQIVKGAKIIESRLYDNKRRNINIGDEITFVSRESVENVLVKVIALHICSNFEGLFNLLSIKSFGVENAQELNLIYDYYKKEEEEKWGVVGIEFEKI